jgi:hypothetical protein
MNEINMRFSLTTDSLKSDIEAILPEILQQGIEDIAVNKFVGWPKKQNKSWIAYCFKFENIANVNECTKFFCRTWQPYSLVLLNLKKLGFSFHINFEFIITDWDFPAIGFEKEFIDFASLHNKTFGMYFWSGDDKYNVE